TMKGYRVARKAGWDTHGLPVELQVEKALGLKSKQEIENIVSGDVRASVIEFNKKCKESVWEYRDLWEKLTKRMGYWVDMEHPYVTYENSYIESVWWQFAQIAELKNIKGESFVYKGYKVVPYCYRCGTALSSHEVAQGYKEVKDNSVYVKFKLLRGQKIGDFETDDKTFMLAWTTTPWTLPGNVALAVGVDIEYVRVKTAMGVYILSGNIYKQWCKRFKEDSTFQLEFTAPQTTGEGEDYAKLEEHPLHEMYSLIKHGKIQLEMFGKDLLGLKYEPLYKTAGADEEKCYRVVSDEINGQHFVMTDSGTGIVHIAPAFGEDDASVAKENDLPTILTVEPSGKMVGGFGLPGEGIAVKKLNDKNRYAVDDLIIADLKERGLFFKDELYSHEYPFCWRCDTPLIYFAKPSWFIRMSEIREELVKNNEGVAWVPDHIKEGRFGEWLKGAKDWAISRERYWGTPIPIWECSGHGAGNKEQGTREQGCGRIKVLSSIAELEKLSGKKIDDVHKPYIDDVTFACECGGTMERVPEVLDVWFDSGAMPLAQFNYPNAVSDGDRKNIEAGKYFPADYICEAIDQTRGWFYTLHAIATLLHLGGKVPEGRAFKNVICLGHVLDGQGKKMSKSKGNVIDPFQMFDEYGADPLRWMLFSLNQPGLPKRFDLKGMRDVQNRVFRMLWNSYSFFVQYAEIDRWQPTVNNKQSTNLLDRWILSELQLLVKSVDELLSEYDVYAPTQKIENFIDHLSNWYIRRNRKRFWKSEDDNDKNNAYQTLHTVLVTLSKVMAPFTPFLAEEMYRNLTGEESVHLADWPVADESLIDEKLNEEMIRVRLLTTVGLKGRADMGVKVRQPLSKAWIQKDISEELKEILKEELNVKEIVIDESVEILKIDISLNDSLILEGEAREIIRAIQEGRKKAGFEVADRIVLCYQGMERVFNGDEEKGIKGFAEEISKEVLATEVRSEKLEDAEYEGALDLDDETFTFQLKRA
ncbi:MAG: isoleucine--tRNA ligase, partial [Candidatus Moraniibacteriota bacterium]